MKWTSYYDPETQDVRVVKIFFHILLAIVIISALGWGWRMFTRPARTVSEVTERTFAGDNVIYQYEHFYDLYHTVRATVQKVKNTQESFNQLVAGLPQDPAGWNYVERESYSNLNNALMGTKNILADQVEQYNADASKINRKLFKSDNLPHQIEIDMNNLDEFLIRPYGR